MNKLLNIGIWTGLAIAFGVIVLISYWSFYPYKLLVFNTPTFDVLTKKVKPGELLMYVSDYCKFTDAQAIVTRTFTNGLVYSTPTIYPSRPAGCGRIVVVIQIPQELPVGTYHLTNNYVFKINPIRDIIVHENTEKFEVIN